VVEPSISARATAAIEHSVGDGGYVCGSCGAGRHDEFSEPGPGLGRVCGIGPAIRGEVHRGEYRVRRGRILKSFPSYLTLARHGLDAGQEAEAMD